MPQLTLDQKRLETLRRQLYGKGESVTKIGRSNIEYRVSPANEQRVHATGDKPSTTNDLQTVLFLKRDLFKILILSTLALSLQILLYLSTKNGLLVLGW